MINPFERQIVNAEMPCRIIGLLQHGAGKCIKLLLSAFIVAGTAGTSYAMGLPPAGTGGESAGLGSMLTSLAPLLLIFVIFYFLLIRPQSKKAKEHKELLENLKKGDKIMTNGGIYGVIEDLDGETITLRVGTKDDVRIKINRSFIAGLRAKE